jgi:hypothetical protein
MEAGVQLHSDRNIEIADLCMWHKHKTFLRNTLRLKSSIVDIDNTL